MTMPTGLKPRGRLTREACGCAHDGEQWIELCAECHPNADKRSCRAMADYRKREGLKTQESPDPWT